MTMIADPPPYLCESYFVELTEDDMRRSVRWWLAELGLTYDELAAMAEGCAFDTAEQKIAWLEIGGYRHLVEG